MRAELHKLVNVDQPRIRADIAKFREDGDLKENAPYHAAREELQHNEARVAQLESILALGYIVDKNRLPKDRAVFGTKVVVENKTEGKDETYCLVGEGETDPDNGWILTTSPMGQMLISKKVGDEVVGEFPGGTFEYEIKEISFIED